MSRNRKTRGRKNGVMLIALWGVSALLGPTSVSGQLATLVEDLAPRESVPGSYFGSLHPFADRVVFLVERNGFPIQHSSDGTPARSVELPVRGLFRGRLEEGLLYGGDRDLWMTDGTVEGSRRLAPPELTEFSLVAIDSFAELNDGTLLILSRDGVVVSQGQRDDARLADLQLPSLPQSVVAAGDIAYLLTRGGEVVATDGDTASIVLATTKRFSSYAVSGARFFFVLEDQDDYELWVADPVRASLVSRIESPGFNAPRIVASTDDGGIIVRAGAVEEQFLLTRGGAFTELSQLPEGVTDDAIVEFEGGFLFTGLDTDGFRYLWKSADEGAVAERVAELCRFCRSPRFEVLGRRMLLHFESSSLFGTDGTSAGTALLADSAAELVVDAGRAQFLTNFGVSRTDGTVAGTIRLVGGLPLTVQSGPSRGAPVHAPLPSGALFLGRTFGSEEVWSVMDGEAPLRVLEEAIPTQNITISRAVGVDGQLLFEYDFNALWVADSNGLRELTNNRNLGCDGSSSPYAILGDRYLVECFAPSKLLSVASDGAVEEIALASFSGGGRPSLSMGDRLLTSAGERVLVTDGTNAGTSVLHSGPSGSFFNILGEEDGVAYFVQFTTTALELFRTNLTPSGTSKVGDLPVQSMDAATVAGGKIYIYKDFDLWQVDSQGMSRRCDRLPPLDAFDVLLSVNGRAVTLAGFEGFSIISTDCDSFTKLGPYSTSTLSRPVVAGDKVYFAGADAPDDALDQAELWVSDGTSLGEPLGARIDTGLLEGLVAFGDRVMVLATEDETGLEPWISDGTKEGTRLLHDLFPGPATSFANALTSAGSTVFFLANDGLVGQELFRVDLEDDPCIESATSLCLNRGRFRVDATWRDFAGNRGVGNATRLTDDTGYFWFFDEDNVEVVLKVLDGTPINGNFWVFSGALSDVFYSLTVTDSETGRSKRYTNPRGNFGSFGDTAALGAGARTGVLEIAASPFGGLAKTSGSTAACTPSPQVVCVNQDRFQIEVDWSTTQGTSGRGNAQQLTEDTGSFWFFDPDNVELVVKVLDATAVNGRFWVFYGSLSNVEYTMRVTDTLTGQVKTYRNENGTFASVGDTAAF